MTDDEVCYIRAMITCKPEYVNLLSVVSKFRTLNWKAIELELSLMALKVPLKIAQN
jgi:hypothetical protein